MSAVSKRMPFGFEGGMNALIVESFSSATLHSGFFGGECYF